MSAASTPRFRFFCGDDDFLVNNAARECFEKLAAGADAFSREVIDGAASKLDDIETILRAFDSAVLTVSMFGDKRHVWLRGVNWLGTDRLSTSEGAKEFAAKLVSILGKADPAATTVVVSAISPNGVRTDVKWLKKEGAAVEFKFAKTGKGAREAEGMLDALLSAECERLGVVMGRDVRSALLSKVGNSPRMATEEVRKLATYLGAGGTGGGAAKPRVTVEMVARLVPDFGETEFFEPVEVFYSRKPEAALDALRRFFFHAANPVGAFRPLLSAFQKRNRLLIQLRAIFDARYTSNGLISAANLSAAAADLGGAFCEQINEKTEYNVFAQNPWYLGNLFSCISHFSLRQLIDIQFDLVQMFEDQMFKENTTPERLFRAFFIKHLGQGGMD